MKTIVMIDDEDIPADAYQEQFADQGDEFILIHGFNDAIDFIRSKVIKPDLWLLDIMIPVGRRPIIIGGIDIRDDLGYGLSAGIFLYRFIKEHHPNAPIMIVTNAEVCLFDDIAADLADGDRCESKLYFEPEVMIEAVNSRLCVSR